MSGISFYRDGIDSGFGPETALIVYYGDAGDDPSACVWIVPGTIEESGEEM